MTMTNFFVTNVIGLGIHGKLAGDFMAGLPEVVGVTLVEEPGLGPIILLQSRRMFPHQILITLPLIRGA